MSSAQLERVIQRAAELQTARESVPDRLNDAEVMRIGEEVGLESQHVHRALIELPGSWLGKQLSGTSVGSRPRPGQPGHSRGRA